MGTISDSRQYIITKMHDVTIGFLMENAHAEEIRCYEADSLLGNIYVGRVSNILNNINAAFVDIAKGESCYLSLEDYHGDRQLKTGDLITVQVIKDKIKTKQAAVTANISISGEYVVVHAEGITGVSAKIADREMRHSLKALLSACVSRFQDQKKCQDRLYGGIVRTKAEAGDITDIENETINLLCKLDDVLYRAAYATAYSCLRKSRPAYIQDIQDLQQKGVQIVTDIPELAAECSIYDIDEPKLYADEMIGLAAYYGLERILDKALSKRVYLKSGAYLVIEPTEAMTVIDVNSGKAIKGKNSEEMRYKLNIEAAQEISRQLQLRNISGMILVDFISMKEEDSNKRLLAELKNFTHGDTVPVQVVDITALGLVEMTRKKIRKPLYEVIKFDR